MARTRLFRPDTFSDDVTGTLEPLTLLIYLGLAAHADDAGYLAWRPSRLAAAIRPYVDPSARIEMVERAATELSAAGLLVRYDCGCAYLPRLVRDLAIKGGTKSYVIQEWHQAHSTDVSVAVRTQTDASGQIRLEPDEAVSVSGSGSGSRSGSRSGSSSLSESGSSSGSDATPGWESGTNHGQAQNATWVDRLDGLGIRDDDATWSAWLTSLGRRHADQTIYDEIRTVIEGGESRPQMIRELVKLGLSSGDRSRLLAGSSASGTSADHPKRNVT